MHAPDHLIRDKKAIDDQLLAVPGVVSVGIGDGEIVVRVVPDANTNAVHRIADGVESTVTIEVGQFFECYSAPTPAPAGAGADGARSRADQPQPPVTRYRPLQPGAPIMVDLPEINGVAVGTMGLPMNDGQRNYITTAAHVLSACMHPQDGTVISQPSPGDPVASAAPRAEPEEDIYSPGNTTVVYDRVKVEGDVGWAPVNQGISVENQPLNIPGTVSPTPADVGVGDPVVKTGHTTGVTHGEVTQVDITYGGYAPNCPRADLFKVTAGGVETDIESARGDSGGPVFVEDGDTLHPAGVVSAKSDDPPRMVYADAAVMESLSGLQFGALDDATQPGVSRSPSKLALLGVGALGLIALSGGGGSEDHRDRGR